MEVEKSGGDGGDRTRIPSHWYWAMASVAQFGWAVSSYRKGYAGNHQLMPLKAFAVASLFIGASTSASVAFLKASGIHKVEDLMEVGTSIRTGLGIRPRARDE
ncbi:hypothetical protein COLO4_12436 [Corchorus olitorius]|uniref:StAR lipid transfer-like protein n=1 Tax=Corchorus olitorius TaxID=93759 RepID=A0A1R3K0T5_9ROSI|nr:hypothetical protein COLO4_12436 [Corchorus olitorius]